MADNTSQKSSDKTCIKLTEDQQFQVLMAQLQERYNAWHQIRSRSTQFTLWIVGMAIALSWKLIESPCSNTAQRIAATILVAVLAVVSLYFLDSLSTGCKYTRKALIRVETALGNHEPNYFLQGQPLLPKQYASTKTRLSSHFLTLYALLVATVGYLLFAIWMPIQKAGQDNVKGPAPAVAEQAAQFQSKSNINKKGGQDD